MSSQQRWPVGAVTIRAALEDEIWIEAVCHFFFAQDNIATHYMVSNVGLRMHSQGCIAPAHTMAQRRRTAVHHSLSTRPSLKILVHQPIAAKSVAVSSEGQRHGSAKNTDPNPTRKNENGDDIHDFLEKVGKIVGYEEKALWAPTAYYLKTSFRRIGLHGLVKLELTLRGRLETLPQGLETRIIQRI